MVREPGTCISQSDPLLVISVTIAFSDCAGLAYGVSELLPSGGGQRPEIWSNVHGIRPIAGEGVPPASLPQDLATVWMAKRNGALPACHTITFLFWYRLAQSGSPFPSVLNIGINCYHYLQHNPPCPQVRYLGNFCSKGSKQGFRYQALIYWGCTQHDIQWEILIVQACCIDLPAALNIANRISGDGYGKQSRG